MFLEHAADGAGRDLGMREHLVACKAGSGERFFAGHVGDAFRNQVRIGIVDGGRRVEEVATDEHGRRFRDVLADFPQGQVALARRGAVSTVLALEAVVPVEFLLQVVVERLERAVALAAPFGDGIAVLVDNYCPDGVGMFREFPEQHQAFAAVAVAAQVQDFGVVRDFGGRVAWRQFRHAALVMPADFHDFFERGREVPQVALVLAFDGAAGRVDGEVVRAHPVARGLCAVFAGDFAHVGAFGGSGFPECLQVVPVHREAVFVEVDARERERCGQVETVAAHAAAQVVNFRTCAGRAFSCVVGCIVPVRPQVCFPAPDILRGALFQRKLVAQEEHPAGGILPCRHCQ